MPQELSPESNPSHVPPPMRLDTEKSRSTREAKSNHQQTMSGKRNYTPADACETTLSQPPRNSKLQVIARAEKEK